MTSGRSCSAKTLVESMVFDARLFYDNSSNPLIHNAFALIFRRKISGAFGAQISGLFWRFFVVGCRFFENFVGEVHGVCNVHS